MQKRIFAVMMALALLFLPAASQATVSNNQTAAVSLTIGESISVSLSSNTLNLSNTSSEVGTINVTYTWQVQQGHYSSGNIYTWLGSGTLPGPQTVVSTQFNGGSDTLCNQSGSNFPAAAGAVAGNACASYTIPQNVATDTSDSQTVPLQITIHDGIFQVGSYTQVVNVLFAIS